MIVVSQELLYPLVTQSSVIFGRVRVKIFIVLVTGDNLLALCIDKHALADRLCQVL